MLAVAALVLAVALMLGVARLGHAASDQARAETAADAAALAAAGCDRPRRRAPSAAAAAARDRGEQRRPARPLRVRRTKPTVEVTLGDATGRARAEVRFECFADPTDC